MSEAPRRFDYLRMLTEKHMKMRHPRCEYRDGRGQCRSDGTTSVFPFVEPLVVAGGYMTASTEYRDVCAKHLSARFPYPRCGA